MMMIDSQVHAYEANTPKRPWHSVPNWPDHVTGDEMVAARTTQAAAGRLTFSYERHAWLSLRDAERSAI
jgi:hypothetical protein